MDGSILRVALDASALRYPIAVDPAWKAAATMATRRRGHRAVRLSSGKVLVAGGDFLSSAELYDPTLDTWSPAGSMTSNRREFTLSLIVVGGTKGGAGTELSTAEIFDPTTNEWSSAGMLSVPRMDATAAVLLSGSLLVAGGTRDSTGPYASTELFAPSAVAATCSGNGECASGFCVDGVCCSTACAGQCEACNLPGTVGTCATVTLTNGPTGYPAGQAVSGFGKTFRASCPAFGTTCGGRCDGTTATSCTYVTSECVPASCSGGVETRRSTCSAGTCPAATTSPCAPYLCGSHVLREGFRVHGGLRLRRRSMHDEDTRRVGHRHSDRRYSDDRHIGRRLRQDARGRYANRKHVTHGRRQRAGARSR